MRRRTLPSNHLYKQGRRVSASKLNALQEFAQKLRNGIDIKSDTIEVGGYVGGDGQSLRMEVYPRLWITTAAPSDDTVTAKQVIASTAATAGPERTFDVPTDPDA